MTELDSVARYAMAKGMWIKPRTVLVEGTSDVSLFEHAAKLEKLKSGAVLLDDQFTMVAAGERDNGGTHGVIRELIALRQMGITCMHANGRPRYRFAGLFDNDKAGRMAVKLAKDIDTSIIEYRDVFRLHPVMAVAGNLDPTTVSRAFERANLAFKGLDWEIEDLLPSEFLETFASDYPTAVTKSIVLGGKTHYELTRDGKAQLHRYVKKFANHDDLTEVITALRAMRGYLNCSIV